MATLHEWPGGKRIFLKGAPEAVLRRCDVGSGPSPESVHEVVHALATRGMRVLAVAERATPADLMDLPPEEVDRGGFRLLGLEGMIDPPREEAIEAVKTCRQAGIAVNMITGDHRLTAQAIGAQIGLGDAPATTGAELATLDDTRLRDVAQRAHVFARVAPEQKLRLVRALQAENHVVAMTGDGVNDAPALKQANFGVAMGITGTAVAKQSADIILADDNFASIAAAIEEGRRVYDNLIKSFAFVLPTNLGLALILIAAVGFFPVQLIAGELVPLMPLMPRQILWINLVASVALSFPLALEVPERDVMARRPRSPNAPVFGGFLVGRTVFVAVLMAAGGVGLFLWEYTNEVGRVGHEVALAEAQTMAVTTIVISQIFYMLNCRSLRESARRIGFFTCCSTIDSSCTSSRERIPGGGGARWRSCRSSGVRWPKDSACHRASCTWSSRWSPVGQSSTSCDGSCPTSRRSGHSAFWPACWGTPPSFLPAGGLEVRPGCDRGSDRRGLWRCLASPRSLLSRPAPSHSSTLGPGGRGPGRRSRRRRQRRITVRKQEPVDLEGDRPLLTFCAASGETVSVATKSRLMASNDSESCRSASVGWLTQASDTASSPSTHRSPRPPSSTRRRHPACSPRAIGQSGGECRRRR
jgi:phosphoserine phosphatase